MAMLRVISPGMQSSVQDLGRAGFADQGLSLSGAADAFSLRLGNRLVGNRDGDAGVEMTLVGGVFEADVDVRVALTGAAGDAVVESAAGARPAPAFEAFELRAGERLRVGMISGGARRYLCVAGGIVTPMVMGSRSTQISAGIGGVDGRALRAADVLPVGVPRRDDVDEGFDPMAEGVVPLADDRGVRVLRCMSAARAVDGENTAAHQLCAIAFEVLEQSDRVGLRLKPVNGGGPLLVEHAGAALTEASGFGLVQVPPSGMPIVLGPDSPPTGGYVVAASVISADLMIVGQLKPRDVVRFVAVSMDEAVRAWKRRELWLDAVREAVDEEDGVTDRHDASAAENVIAQSRPRGFDLNCDIGEISEQLEMDLSAARVFPTINIACGGHAGDWVSMTLLVRAGRRAGARIGAHPSYPDAANFGRRSMGMEIGALEAEIRGQIERLARIAAREGARLSHVKPHGALYHDAMKSPEVAGAIARAAAAVDPALALMGLAGAPALRWWREAGASVIAEAFADRRYEADGSLRDRALPGAVIGDHAAMLAQATMIARSGCAHAADGTMIEISADTICVHSDTAGALAAGHELRAALGD
jgi:5-oxoprolinase (ATP-hydrolysing) subunit A